MSVTVDQQPFATEELGLQTVGQVLTHLQQDDRLVVQLLIDGQQPDLAEIQTIRKSLVNGRTLYIETANPRQMALEVLDDVQEQLAGAEEFKNQAVELLQQNQIVGAMEKLGIYFSTWQSAQESVLKTSQLLRIDLEVMRAGTIDRGDFNGIHRPTSADSPDAGQSRFCAAERSACVRNH